MTAKNFKLGASVVWVLVIANFLLITIGASMKLIFGPFGAELIVAWLMLYIIVDIIMISDIYYSNIQNKSFWILSMIIFGSIAPIIYLIRRDRLMGE
jgi:hypothetical protein